MLIVVEYRNLQPAAQPLLDVEALGRLDVFEIEAAKRGLEAGDNVHQLVRIALIDFDVENIDAGELLEQHTLAFHHRLGCQRSNCSQSQHGGAVGDHADQIAPCGVVARVAGIVDDFFAGCGDAG